MTEHQTLANYLESGQDRDDLRQAVATTTLSSLNPAVRIAEIIALGPLAGTLSASHGEKRRWRHPVGTGHAGQRLIISLNLSMRRWPTWLPKNSNLPVPINQGAPLYRRH